MKEREIVPYLPLRHDYVKVVLKSDDNKLCKQINRMIHKLKLLIK